MTPPLATVRTPAGSVLLRLPVDAYALAADRLSVGGVSLLRKRELHITLLNSELATRLADRLGEGAVLDVLRQVDWQPLRTGDGSVLGDPDDAERMSLVEWVQLDGFNASRHALAVQAGIPVPRTRAHITHYASDAKGIGLPDIATIQRMQLADVRLPGVAPERPKQDPATVQREYAGGCSLLPPDLEVRLDETDPAIDRWLDSHAASQAWLLTAADPLGTSAQRLGNALRWAMLDDHLSRTGIRTIEALGQDDAGEPLRTSLCLLGAHTAFIDRLLHDYEQLAAVRVQVNQAPCLHLHPDLRSTTPGENA